MATKDTILFGTDNDDQYNTEIKVNKTTGAITGTDQSGNTTYYASVLKDTYRAAADVVVTNSEVFVSTGIAIPIKASETLSLKGLIGLRNGHSGVLTTNYKLTVPSGCTALGSIALSADAGFGQTDLTAEQNIVGQVGLNSVSIQADVINSTTAGTITLVFAQDTATAAATTTELGSNIDPKTV